MNLLTIKVDQLPFKSLVGSTYNVGCCISFRERGAQIIDINMGCPAKKVVKRYAGSALMRDSSLASDIIKAVVKATSLPTTLKMRLGWDEDTKNAPELARIAENNGIKLDYGSWAN